MADEPTPTPTSEPTPTPTPSDPPAGDPKPAADDPAPKDGDLGTTAVGNGDPTDPPADPDADPAPKPDVPEQYELKAPEGFEIDEASLEAATPVFKELGLSNEQADKLMPVAADFAKRLVEQRDQQFLGQILEQRKTWLNDAKADKEIGGANWDATMQASARALDQLGFPKGSPLRAALDESGFGNHPEMIRLMAKVGKAIGEDSDFVRSDANTSVKKSPEEILYPNDIPQQGAK